MRICINFNKNRGRISYNFTGQHFYHWQVSESLMGSNIQNLMVILHQIEEDDFFPKC